MPDDLKEAARVKDQLFLEPRRIDDFNFGTETAAVFDDMLDRSVPFYDEIQRMLGELAADFAVQGSAIYDLGCSTASSFLAIGAHLTPDAEIEFVGLDSSPDMLLLAERKLRAARFPWRYRFERADLDRGADVTNASVVLLVLTLQFLRPLNRERLISSIYEGMKHNGCLLLVEKVLGEHSTVNRLFINHYYEMKRRKGYSEIEIAQKRESLENVLIPYRAGENELLLRQAGFRHVDMFFKWYNFCGVVAVK